MHINFNGQELELSFGLRFVNEIDRELGFDVDQMAVGQGLNLLIPNLKQTTLQHYQKSLKRQ